MKLAKLNIGTGAKPITLASQLPDDPADALAVLGMRERAGHHIPAIGRARVRQGDGRDPGPRLPRLIGLRV